MYYCITAFQTAPVSSAVSVSFGGNLSSWLSIVVAFSDVEGICIELVVVGIGIPLFAQRSAQSSTGGTINQPPLNTVILHILPGFCHYAYCNNFFPSSTVRLRTAMRTNSTHKQITITHTTNESFRFQTGMNYADYRCLDVSNFDVVEEEDSWTKSSSPWSTPRECWWPIDTEDERLCTASSGQHKCPHNPEYMEESEFRWCGSNYDALGNSRFKGGVIEGEEWTTDRLMDNATYVESLSWGYTTFDNIFVAFLSIFQSITMEGWSEIQYQVTMGAVQITVHMAVGVFVGCVPSFAR